MPVYVVRRESQKSLTPGYDHLRLNEQGFPILQGRNTYAKEKRVKVSNNNQMRLKGYVDDPNYYIRSYGNRGVVEKFFGIPFNILRKISREFIVVSSILRLRSYQAQAYAQPWEEDDKPGLRAVLRERHKEPSQAQLKVMKEMEEWAYQTGRRDFEGAVKRKDRFPQFIEKFIRDMLTLDRVAVSRRLDVSREVVDFSIIDAATIKPVDPYVGFDGDKDIAFVQDINGSIIEGFSDEEVIVDWMYHITDIEHQYFGWSPLEESFKETKSTISALRYNSGNFTDNKAPKGFFTMVEGIGESDLDELEERWNALFTGAESAFRTPFFSGHDIKYNSVGATNRDMEYSKYMDHLMLLLFGNFSVDPAELGWKFDRSQALFGEKQDKKQDKSKDRGLGALLDALARMMNRLIEPSNKWAEFKFVFTGRKNIDKDAKLESDVKKLANYVTVGETRKENDRPSLEELAKEMGLDDDEEYMMALKKNSMLILNAQYMQGRESGQPEPEGFGGEEGGLEDDFEGGDEDESAPGAGEEEEEEEKEATPAAGTIDLVQKSMPTEQLSFWVELE